MLQKRGGVRFNGIHQVLQDVLKLGSVLFDLIEGTGIGWLTGVGRLDAGIRIRRIHGRELVSLLLLSEH